MKDTKVYLEHILEAIDNIEMFIDGVERKVFEENIEKQYAVFKALEIIGEAAKQVPLILRKKYPTVPWKRIAGPRDKLTHAYFMVNLDLVWNIIIKDLPTLQESIEKIVKEP